MDVGVQAFGVADVLEDPSSKVCQAAVLREHQPRPGVTLSHIKGRDSHGTPNLMHNINGFTSEEPCHSHGKSVDGPSATKTFRNLHSSIALKHSPQQLK